MMRSVELILFFMFYFELLITEIHKKEQSNFKVDEIDERKINSYALSQGGQKWISNFEW